MKDIRIHFFSISLESAEVLLSICENGTIIVHISISPTIVGLGSIYD